MVVFTNPGFVVQTLCFKSHLAFFACMVGEGVYIYIYVGSCATSYSPG